MAKRFIDTGLFDDSWFMDLSKDGKLLWLYLITKCDHAGILDFNEKLCKTQTGIDKLDEAFKQLGNRCLTVREQYKFLPKFIFYQYPNFPNSSVRSQLSALNRLKEFNLIKELDNGSLTVNIGLDNSYGYGNGNGTEPVCIEKGGMGEKTWRDDFNIYISELREAFQKYTSDPVFIAEREKYHPAVDIKLSIEKACKDYWSKKDKGWKHKKKSKSKELDWKATFENVLDQSYNRVYKPRTNSNIVSETKPIDPLKVMCEDGVSRNVGEIVTIEGEKKIVGRDGKFKPKW